MGRGLLAETLGNFNIVAKYPVVAHFQRLDARQFFFPGLNFGHGAVAAGQDIPQPVGLLAVARADQLALPDRKGGIVHNGPVNAGFQIGKVVQLFGQGPGHGGIQLAQGVF